MKIWVDADACPKPVRAILIRTADRLKINLVFVSNQFHRIPESGFVKTLQVPGGFDVADEYIINEVSVSDLVITSDIPLASVIVQKNAFVLTPYGKFYSADNINNALSVRNLKMELKSAGHEIGGQSSFSQKDREKFANQLDGFLRRMKTNIE
ncbi:MAG: YaiI/YqxD family protein [Calditrichaceae bacterium]|nr:YaiI/YqxD family protein [Calditrichaceae bacterium]MBN2710161.1 YaiI/YqxD family protein [Calditrichaceae bacterium]RQV95814.1 MAG: YaiI/YqxD family protein [Calditrichota bacterium]